MGTIGLFSLLIAFFAALVGVVGLCAGHAFRSKSAGETLSWAGRITAVIAFVSLTISCGVLVVCFFNGDVTIQYVLSNHVETSGGLSNLYRISGLWAGREGSLLFWTWIISLFTCIVSLRRINKLDEIDNIAVLVLSVVLCAFVAVMLFSEANMPFTATADTYFKEDGTLNMAASLLGMNSLLQHWAMAIHPPTLFLGYAGLTVPFAYAISAVVCNDSSSKWVLRCERYTLASWLFLTIGIGLGAVWAYVVLGWGGYWGWDPVENASLLAWLVCVAQVHTFSMYKRRGAFKRWAVMTSCLAFTFVIVGTFISRSGIVQSVHAFEGDPASLALFGALIALSVLAGAAGCILRGKSFGSAEEEDDTESMVSRNMAFYLNNLIMLVMAILLAYLTVASALPSWMPFGGESVSTGTYNAIARPIGILYLLMMAACPLLGWRKSDRKAFAKKAKAPGICALVFFVVLCVYSFAYLFPAYDAIIAQGGTTADALLSDGPTLYYKGLTILGFAVAALLLMNSLFQVVRLLKSGKPVERKLAATTVVETATKEPAPKSKSRIAMAGGAISHVATALILVGLIASSMYVTEVSGYMAYDSETDTCSETFQIKDYELTFVGSNVSYKDNSSDVLYQVELEVTKGGKSLGTVSPDVQLVMTTQQQKLNAAVISTPLEDLFVVYQGVNATTGALSMNVRVNPLISVVWAGFVLLCIGMLLSMVGSRGEGMRQVERRANSLRETGEEQ